MMLFVIKLEVVECGGEDTGIPIWHSSILYLFFLDFSFSFDLQRSNISPISKAAKGKATLKVMEFFTLLFLMHLNI